MKRKAILALLLAPGMNALAQTPTIVSSIVGSNLYSYNGYAYFQGTGQHPFFSDGTAAGTIALDTSNANDNPDGFVLAGSNVYFVYNNLNPGNGNQLWKTNNTPAGTGLVKAINPNQYGASLGVFGKNTKVAFNNDLVFTATDGSSASYEPWISDGTAAGTHMIANVQATTNYGSGAVNYTIVNGKVVYFTCDYWTCGTGAYRVWAYDGVNNQRIDGGFAISGLNSAPGKVFQMGNKTYFAGTDGSSNTLVYQTDGSTFTYAASIPLINGMVSDGTTIYTEGYSSSTGWQLHKLDMNFTTDSMVKQINPVNGGHNIFDLTIFNNMVYFFANDNVHGIELWRSDGTAAGTVMVKDILPGSSSSYPTYNFNNLPTMFVMCGKLFFNANDSIHGQELWMSDGTTAGTQMVADLCSGTCSAEIQEAAISNGRMYFVTHDAAYNYSLYKMDVCYSPFSVNEIHAQADVSIYPNPTNDQIHIENGSNIETVLITDVLGKEIRREKLRVNTGEVVIAAPDQEGIYFITVQTKEGSVTKKIVKR